MCFSVRKLKHILMLQHHRILRRCQMKSCEAEETNEDRLFVGFLATLYQLQRIYKVSEFYVHGSMHRE